MATLKFSGENPIAEVDNDFLIYLGRVGVREKEMSDLSQEELKKMESAVMRGANGAEVLKRALAGEVREEVLDQINLEDGEKCYVMPSMKREVVYVAGMQGMGKSYFVKEYARRFHMMFPSRGIIIVSPHIDDETYEDGVAMTHYLPEEFMQLGVFKEELKDSLIIFDDIDNESGDTAKYYKEFSQNLISNARKYGVYVIYISHMICDGKKTAAMLNGANKIVIFPMNNAAQNERCMKVYCGLKKENMERIEGLKYSGALFPWACINRTSVPAYVIHEKGVFLL